MFLSMMKKSILKIDLVFMAGLLFAVASSSAFADESKVCTTEESKIAEQLSSQAKSWGDIYFVFKRYSHCDDGAIGEGITDSVTDLLAFKWNTFPQLKKIIHRDKKFSNFLVRHIDESAPSERLEKIKLNAQSQCAKGEKKICEEIESAAVAALQHM